MPKAICSPARSSEANKHRRHLKKFTTRAGIAAQASPLIWTKTKPMGSEISEPTSPKVTCAGQIKIRHKATRPCKSWQSVMEEIERLHHKKHEKKSSWVESFGIKKEVMQFLTCLRNIRLDFRCFGVFPASDITTDDEDEEEEDDNEEGNEASRTVFSRWLMLLQENQDSEFFKNDSCKEEKNGFCADGFVDAPTAPPPNALLLMRCRSAPVKTRLKEKEYEEEVEEDEKEEDDNENEDHGKKENRKGRQLKLLMEEEKRKEEEEKRKKESLVEMKYDTGLYKISPDIAKETWVFSGTRDPFSRSRSWKR